MESLKTDYLIIGNSAAGVTAAEQIRAHAPEARIVIVSDEPYAVYGRPLISYLVEGKTDEEHIGFKPEGFYEEQRLDALLGPDYRVVRLDAAAHQALLANGTAIDYGKCLLATGSVPFVPPIAGLDGCSRVFTFLTLDDAKGAWGATVEATEAAHKAGRRSRVVVIGGGLIGLKAAEALSHHADEVLVLELAPHILPAVLDEQGAAILQERLAEDGIRCMPGISMEKLRCAASPDPMEAVLTNGEVVTADVVVAAVGVRPNSALAVEAGAEQGRGLICDETMRTTLPDVYAAGDVVQVRDLLDGAQRPLALWPNAMRQGRMAGLHMVGAADAEPFEGSFAVNAVDFFDASLLTAGLINPPDGAGCAQEVIVGDGSYAKFVTRDDRLVGYILLNRPANAGIYTSLIEQKTPLSTLEGPIFEEAPINLDFPQEARWERLHRRYPRNRDERGWKERG